jgi:ATP-dependent helicase HrpA
MERMETLREEITYLEDKLRRPGMLWNEEAVIQFLQKRIPKEISTAAAFHKWRYDHEDSLMMGMKDVVWEDLHGLEFFPDVLRHAGEEYPTYYHYAPGERDDGVTLGVHVDQLPAMPEWLAGWGVDGNLEERAELLMRGLAKDFRRSCQPIADVARSFADQWAGVSKETSVIKTLAAHIERRTGAVIPLEEFDAGKIPFELVTKIWVCDDEGEELAIGEDVSELKLQLADRMRERFEAAATADVERRGMSSWDGESLAREVKTAGGPAFPALVDEGGTVGVRAFTDLYEAREAHRRGGARLLVIGSGQEVDYLRKKYPIGMHAKIEMSRLGIDIEELLLLAAEGASGGGEFPRSPEAFAKLQEASKGKWYEAGTRIATALDEVIEAEREIRDWIERHQGDRNFGEIAEDLDEQLQWLMRDGFVWKAGFETFLDLPRKFRALRSRLGRISGLPLVKDLEKMDLIRPLWCQWNQLWKANPDQPSFWEIGWMLEEWRINLFAPDIETKHKVSAKRIARKLEELGIKPVET